jgi:serine/arginine repetitive matrix protein 2
MTLEQWHLDVVDAFAAELGSEECAWDEKVLAKRVFALLVVEERRRAGNP